MQRELLEVERLARALLSDRSQIKSVYLEFADGKLLATSTDSHRLSFCEEPLEACRKAPPRMVPIDAVDGLLGILDAEQEVELGVVGQELAFRVGVVTYSTQVLSGEYPPFRQHFVTAPECGALVSRKAFPESLSSVEKASASTAGNHVVLALSNGTLRLTAEGKGGAEDEIEAKYDGREVTVCSNGRYLIDALAAIDSDEVRLGIGGDLDPMWIRPETGTAVFEIVVPSRPLVAGAR